MKYRWVSKKVADGWFDRYIKDMRQDEFDKWTHDFDKDTIVYVEVDGIQFLTRDYIQTKRNMVPTDA